MFSYYSIRLLQMSPNIHEIGGIVWPLFCCNLICWVFVYLCICGGVKSVGKVSNAMSHIGTLPLFLIPGLKYNCFSFLQIVYFTVLFPYVVLFALFIRGVTLPGAGQGILYFILPDWSQLKNPKV